MLEQQFIPQTKDLWDFLLGSFKIGGNNETSKVLNIYNSESQESLVFGLLKK